MLGESFPGPALVRRTRTTGEEGDKKKGKLLFPDWGPFKKEKKAKKAPKKKKASIGKTVKGLIGESLRVPPPILLNALLRVCNGKTIVTLLAGTGARAAETRRGGEEEEGRRENLSHPPFPKRRKSRVTAKCNSGAPRAYVLYSHGGGESHECVCV